MIIWHNPECSKSKNCIKILNEKAIKFEIRKYLEDSPTKKELEDLITMMKVSNIRDIMRTKEDEYKALDLDNQDKSNDDLVNAMIKFPKLIERPIGINNGVACIGRPLENILNII